MGWNRIKEFGSQEISRAIPRCHGVDSCSLIFVSYLEKQGAFPTFPLLEATTVHKKVLREFSWPQGLLHGTGSGKPADLSRFLCPTLQDGKMEGKIQPLPCQDYSIEVWATFTWSLLLITPSLYTLLLTGESSPEQMGLLAYCPVGRGSHWAAVRVPQEDTFWWASRSWVDLSRWSLLLTLHKACPTRCKYVSNGS